MKKFSSLFSGLSALFIFFLAACAASGRNNDSTEPILTETRRPLPSLTGTPSPVPPSATPSQTFTPTATLHPLTIEAMRQGVYPGSLPVIEEQLAPGANYSRAIASYQSEGLKIYGLLTVPDGQPPLGGWPVIVFLHGYIPPEQYQTTERYIAYVNYFATRGYIVFKPDLRGHGNSEGEARGAYSSPAYSVDVLNAINAMRQYAPANAEKIGLWGHSMGGYLALRAMVIDPNIRAGVIWAGVVGSYSDMTYNWRPTPIPTLAATARRFSQEILSTYGEPQQNPDFWNSISAISYVSDLSGPIQLHHAQGDSEVPFAFSQSLYDAAMAAGKEAEFYAYPGDDHNIANSFGLAMQRSVEFFDRYLK